MEDALSILSAVSDFGECSEEAGDPAWTAITRVESEMLAAAVVMSARRFRIDAIRRERDATSLIPIEFTRAKQN